MEWGLWGGDVATAFLQSEPDARELPLFLRPPRDELQRRAKSFPHRLYSIEGNLYGFALAPKTWIKHVVRTLTVAQFLTHRLDHMCLYKRCSRGYLQVILIVHVDDFLVAFRKDYNMDELLGMFTWGNKAYLEKGKPLTFRGNPGDGMRQHQERTPDGREPTPRNAPSSRACRAACCGLEDNPDQTIVPSPA